MKAWDGFLRFIDLGVNNFVTMVNNAGQRPVIVKGNVIKAINQFYNKQLLRSTLKRNHKVSKLITSYYIIDRIDTVVIDKNKQDKNKINIGGVNNQNFV